MATTRRVRVPILTCHGFQEYEISGDETETDAEVIERCRSGGADFIRNQVTKYRMNWQAAEVTHPEPAPCDAG